MMPQRAPLVDTLSPVPKPTADEALRALGLHILERFSLARLEWRGRDGNIILAVGLKVHEAKTRALSALNPKADAVFIQDLQADPKTFLDPIAYQAPALRAMVVLRFNGIVFCGFDQLPRPDFAPQTFADLGSLSPLLDFLLSATEAEVKQNPAALWLDAQSQSLRLNASAQHMLGLEQSTISWAQFVRLIHPDDQAVLLASVARACHQGQDFDLKVRTLSGQKLRFEGGRLEGDGARIGAVISPFEVQKSDLNSTLKAPLMAILDFAKTTKREGTDVQALHALRAHLAQASEDILKREKALKPAKIANYRPDTVRIQVWEWFVAAMAHYDAAGRVQLHGMIAPDFTLCLDQKALKIALSSVLESAVETPVKGSLSLSVSRLIYQNKERLRLSWRGVSFNRLSPTCLGALKALKAQYGFIKTPKDGQNLWIEIPADTAAKPLYAKKNAPTTRPEGRLYGLSKRESRFLAIQSEALRKRQLSV